MIKRTIDNVKKAEVHYVAAYKLMTNKEYVAAITEFKAAMKIYKRAKLKSNDALNFINANMVLNNSPETQFTFHILGAAAQFERNLISRRTREGMAAAKSRGVRFGSPLKIAPDSHPKLIKMWEDGVTIPKMAKAFNVSTTTIRRYRRSLGLPARGKDQLRDITKRPEWASVALDNKSKYTHINGIENAMTWSQKKADEYWAKRA